MDRTVITVRQSSGRKDQLRRRALVDGKGGTGGKKKPKLSKAQKLNKSSSTGLQIYNIPVHGFSIQADHLTQGAQYRYAHVSSTSPSKNDYCNGDYGLSIGSVGGRSNTVKDVTMSNTQVVNSQK
ncbi:uncharacterized protein APUU_70557S [Aspergillus puulaauensis]|uniref:Uncharacterized protein n=1 Tax=Aspergillus puulaauensis TaxID=1220207 RepID=A0A7R7XWH2_9EURO|nr:uncharacterized protein APUU_70557S [Aspergillus puulaauensis]BCS28987.1 hypothetical protein APUU_70557S [Aspergillus puulaauensis]